ncbi:hypothetical protein WKI71_31335 [Streptomyces sp. MS1.AVA.1]|uniref:Uncharacterized protein n=1 Tax=Streptomyces machairae TaxID=3134109 RepID=A0ABU8UQS7_9ACTN
MRGPGRPHRRRTRHPPPDPVLPPLPRRTTHGPGPGRRGGPAAAAHGVEGGATLGPALDERAGPGRESGPGRGQAGHFGVAASSTWRRPSVS